MRHIKTDDGIQIEYQTRGSGPTELVFLHGWGGAASYWDEFLDKHLNLEGIRATTLSYRGHGGSDKVDHGYELNRLSDDLFSVADAIGAENLILVGFSMSGRFAQFMAATHPDRVSGLILLNPVPASPLPLSMEVVETWIRAAFESSEEFRKIFFSMIKVPPPAHLVDLYLANIRAASPVALRATSENCMTESIVDKVAGKIACPILIINGTADPMLPDDYVRREVKSLYPQSRMAQVNTGHESILEMPVETAGLIEAFLAAFQTKSK